MLVMTRKLNEKVMIGDNIVVTIVRIDPHTVRIGIDAPDDVLIFREEVLKKINQQSQTEE